MRARVPSPAGALLAALLLGASLAGSGCVSQEVRESAETVLTLQSGTVSALRAQRGTGPFRTYPVAPDVMVGVVEEAAHRARGEGGVPVHAIFASPWRGEVVAKERAGKEALSASYEGPFRTAMLAVVHPVPGDPHASQVEIHAIQRGPFHRGRVAWELDMPGWIDEVLAERARVERAPPAPLPPAAQREGTKRPVTKP